MRLGTGLSGATLDHLHTVRRVTPVSGRTSSLVVLSRAPTPRYLAQFGNRIRTHHVVSAALVQLLLNLACPCRQRLGISRPFLFGDVLGARGTYTESRCHTRLALGIGSARQQFQVHHAVGKAEFAGVTL